MLRYGKLDSWRGFWLVNMIVYHAVWDLLFFGTPQRLDLLFSAPLVIWQQAICWSFIWLSGFVVDIGSLGAHNLYAISWGGRVHHNVVYGCVGDAQCQCPRYCGQSWTGVHSIPRC